MVRKAVVAALVLLWGSLWTTGFDQGWSREQHLVVHRCDETGVTFDYVMPELEALPLMIGNQEYQLLRMAEFGYTEQVGAPQMPQLKLLVGLPLEGDVHVTLLNAEWEERDGYQVAPVPTLIPQVEDESIRTREEYIPDPDFYTIDASYPRQIVEIEKPTFLRNQRVVGVMIRPVQFYPLTGKLRIYSRVFVGVQFESRGVEPTRLKGQPRDLFEDVYQRVLVNYEAAKQWRRPKTVTAKGSVFQEDQDWYKVKVGEDGLYRLDYESLSDAGINLTNLDPRTIRLFNGGGRELPRDLADSRPDSLTELAIIIGGEEDGSFDPEDYILFYGQGLSGWDYDPVQDSYSYYFNHYTDENIYWLTFSSQGPQGKRMASRDGSLSSPNSVRLESFRDQVREEEEFTNPSFSGLEWFWYTSSGGETKTFLAELPGAVPDSLCTITVRMKGKTKKELGFHEVNIYLNDHHIAHTTFQNDREHFLQEEGRGWVVGGTNELRIEHVRQLSSDPSQTDQIYFDWYEVHYWRRYEAQNGELEFFSRLGFDVAEYSLSGFSEGSVDVFDVTDPFNAVVFNNLTMGETLRFQDRLDDDTEKRYYALEHGKYRSPLGIVKAELEGLRGSTSGADYLIITHEDFVSAVEPLRIHRQNFNGFMTKTVKTSAIYDEFSWGLFDPTAIRDFLTYAFENWIPSPAYLLFVGDGHYDYKNQHRTSPTNWIPPFENGSEAYDDWYVYLDGDRTPDLSAGRLPAQSYQHVQRMVKKIKEYDIQPKMGPWRNRVLLLADDEMRGCTYVAKDDSWNTVHTNDTETLSRRSIPRNFEQAKVYLMEYELDHSCKKPGATDDILAHVNDGVVLWNYIGHGGYEVMADEDAFRSTKAMPRLNNEGLPFLLAAFTCDLGVFDRPKDESLAEDMVRAEEKGSIATIAASRGTSSGPNFFLSQKFYAHLFLGDVGFGKTSTFGEALLEAKIAASTQSTARLYLLFGDPVQRLSVPHYEVVVTRLQPDTLRALEVIDLEGEIIRTNGSVVDDFNGTALINVLDSVKPVVHTTPDGGQEVHYQLPGAVLFRGVVPVVNGSFQTQYVIPKDITYGGETGRISIYVSNDTFDGVGYRDSLVTAGGIVNVVDSDGPTIEMTIFGREDSFAEGDYVQLKDTLKATFFDSSGINITGEAGHWIVLKMDGDDRTRVNLTPYFVYDEGSYQRGSVEYSLTNVTPGQHTVEIKAWDNHNNASVQSLFLRVVDASDFRILDVMNYPNPFIVPLHKETTFTYRLTQPALDVMIKIYTVAGRLVRTLRDLPGCIDFNQTNWGALDEDGDRVANGVYLYKVIATFDEGKRREQIERLIVMR